MADTKVTPEVTWAQRSSETDVSKNFIYLTIVVPDVPKENLKLDLQATTLSFAGRSETLKRTYQLDLDFYGEIDPAASNINHTAQHVALKLQKKELKAEYWPRLLKDSKKMHFLKTDFDKWVDEDEQEEKAEKIDFGGMGGMPGMPGMGGMGGGDFGGIDFSKLGGGGGAGLGDDDEEDEDEDEDDMPGLEEDDDTKPEEAKPEEAKPEEAKPEGAKPEDAKPDVEDTKPTAAE